jgi:hypothetical protein
VNAFKRGREFLQNRNLRNPSLLILGGSIVLYILVTLAMDKWLPSLEIKG